MFALLDTALDAVDSLDALDEASAAIRDAATYTDPQKLAEGVSDVLVNGVAVRLDGRFTDAVPGRVLRPADRK